MSSPNDLLRALRRRAAAEHGGFLIEVIVSAALIVGAGGGVLMAMEGATRQAGEQRLQAIAADVGQSDMERLRSQKFDYLTRLVTTPEERQVATAGTTFTVVSRSDWAMQAPPGAVQCTNSARNPEALRISTTVTWPRMNRQPVRLTSLVAAPYGSGAQRGTYVVQVTNRNGVGLDGIPVAMTGPTPVTGTTDTNGCVRFTELMPGDYTIQFSRAGYIDYDGNATVIEPTTVVGGQTKSTPFELDRAGRGVVQIRYDSDPDSGRTSLSTPNPLPTHISIDNALMTPSHRSYALGSAAFSTPDLYPFAGGYQVYADSCTAAMPPTPMNMVIDPGNFTRVFDLQLPVLDIRPANSDGGDKVYVKTACGNFLPAVTLVDGTRNNDPGRITAAYPYGTAAAGFTVCAVDVTDNSWDTVTVSNTSYDVPNRIDGNDALNVNDRTSSPPCGAGWTFP